MQTFGRLYSSSNNGRDSDASMLRTSVGANIEFFKSGQAPYPVVRLLGPLANSITAFDTSTRLIVCSVFYCHMLVVCLCHWCSHESLLNESCI